MFYPGLGFEEILSHGWSCIISLSPSGLDSYSQDFLKSFIWGRGALSSCVQGLLQALPSGPGGLLESWNAGDGTWVSDGKAYLTQRTSGPSVLFSSKLVLVRSND